MKENKLDKIDKYTLSCYNMTPIGGWEIIMHTYYNASIVFKKDTHTPSVARIAILLGRIENVNVFEANEDEEGNIYIHFTFGFDAEEAVINYLQSITQDFRLDCGKLYSKDDLYRKTEHLNTPVGEVYENGTFNKILLFHELSNSTFGLSSRVYGYESGDLISLLAKVYVDGKLTLARIEMLKNEFYVSGIKPGYHSIEYPTYQILDKKGPFSVELFQSWQNPQTGPCFPGCVRNEEELKYVLRDYYPDFKEIFSPQFVESNFVLTPTEKYYERLETVNRETRKYYVPRKEELNKLFATRNQAIIEQQIASRYYMLPDVIEAELIEMFCKKNGMMAEQDISKPLYTNMVYSFEANLPGSIHPKSKNYVPLFIFLCKRPDIITRESNFRWNDEDTLYKSMVNNSNSKQAAIILGMYDIFQRVLLGEVEPNIKSIIMEFNQIDIKYAWGRSPKEWKWIEGIAIKLVFYYTALALEEAEEKTEEEHEMSRNAILGDLHQEIIRETNCNIRDSLMHVFPVRNEYFNAITTRDDRICELIRQAQQDRKKHHTY